MVIGLDGLLLRKQNAGSLRYFQQLLHAFNETGSKENLPSFRVFCSDEVINAIFPEAVNLLLTPLSKTESTNMQLVRAEPNRYLPGALQQQLYRRWDTRVHTEPLSLLHSPVFAPPISFHGKTVMTVQDLTFHLFPQTQKWTGRLWWKIFSRWGFKRADRIVAISNNTRKDLCQYFGVPQEKVSVVHHYVMDHFHPVHNQPDFLQKYGLPEKFILFVGTIEPRKNLVFTLHAYQQARARARLNHHLVIAGSKGWMSDEVYQTIETLGINGSVIFLDYVDDADLPGLYSAADLLLFLSLYEGFGIPPLEAMSCGTPVIASNSSSIPEVVGDAGVLVSPTNLEEAVESIIQVLQDRNLHTDLAERGFARAKLFSRERFKSEMLVVYQQASEIIQ